MCGTKISGEMRYKKTDHVYVVCTGPSLTGFDLGILEGRHVIAVNGAAQYFNQLDAIVSLDLPKFEQYYQEWKEFKEVGVEIISVKDYWPGKAKDDLVTTYLEMTGSTGIDYAPGKVRHGFNSGYTALHVAINRGAGNVHLLGMDLSDGYFYDRLAQIPVSLDYVIAHLEMMKQDLNKRPWVNVWNYSTECPFEGFPKRSLDKIEMTQNTELP